MPDKSVVLTICIKKSKGINPNLDVFNCFLKLSFNVFIVFQFLLQGLQCCIELLLEFKEKIYEI